SAPSVTLSFQDLECHSIFSHLQEPTADAGPATQHSYPVNWPPPQSQQPIVESETITRSASAPPSHGSRFTPNDHAASTIFRNATAPPERGRPRYRTIRGTRIETPPVVDLEPLIVDQGALQPSVNSQRRTRVRGKRSGKGRKGSAGSAASATNTGASTASSQSRGTSRGSSADVSGAPSRSRERSFPRTYSIPHRAKQADDVSYIRRGDHLIPSAPLPFIGKSSQSVISTKQHAAQRTVSSVRAVACDCCRMRRWKCDLAKPTCGLCSHSGRSCIYSIAPSSSTLS
ncbi:hypothetical protein BKA62DRAFT_721076, partial [Auriculariales sp. MPI-PUGE-AT-0066]